MEKVVRTDRKMGALALARDVGGAGDYWVAMVMQRRSSVRSGWPLMVSGDGAPGVSRFHTHRSIAVGVPLMATSTLLMSGTVMPGPPPTLKLPGEIPTSHSAPPVLIV
jgi:hypothetical protein